MLCFPPALRLQCNQRLRLNTLTTTASVVISCYMMVVFGFGVYQSNSATEYPKDCTGAGCVIGIEQCPGLYRPFTLIYDTGSHTVSIGCGWGSDNTVFRSIVVWLALAACFLLTVSILCSKPLPGFIATWVLGACSAASLCVLTLDINSIRAGQEACEQLIGGFQRDGLSCRAVAWRREKPLPSFCCSQCISWQSGKRYTF